MSPVLLLQFCFKIPVAKLPEEVPVSVSNSKTNRRNPFAGFKGKYRVFKVSEIHFYLELRRSAISKIWLLQNVLFFFFIIIHLFAFFKDIFNGNV